MPLQKSILSTALGDVFERRPALAAEAASEWARAYVAYAGGALSAAASLPVNAQANQGIVLGAFTAAFDSRAPAAAGGLMAQGVSAFWLAAVWTGVTAAGTTIVPGNFALAGALAAVFADLSEMSADEKAGRLADAFDAGARQVMVSDIPFVQPAPPVVGPIQ